MKKRISISKALGIFPRPRKTTFIHRWKQPTWLFPLAGLLSVIWFLVRVIPKPSRASYPCMRVAVPLGSSFIVWLLGFGGSVIAVRCARKWIRESRHVWATLCVTAALAGACFGVFAAINPMTSASLQQALSSETMVDPVNDPIGEPKGCNPGRVVWVYDADATDWDGPSSGESCWEPSHTNQAVVDSMMSRSLRWLAGKPTDAEAWDAAFRYFNREHGKGDMGYRAGERIAIKINLTSCNASASANKATREKTTYLDKASDTSPQVTLAVLRQLVHVVEVDQSDISVGDPVSYFPKQWYEHMAPEFPDVHYLDHYPFPGRTQVQHSTTALYWSTIDANGKVQDYLPVSFVEADYIINLAVLKGHAAGITVCAKNHYGSMIRNPTGYEWGEQKNYYNLHDSLPWATGSPGRSHYRALVDLMGHADLGGKTVLYMIDGLFGGYYWEGTPYKWIMPPFNGDWPSSLFASQDPVAIDSVAHDFLREEWPNVVEDGQGEPGSLQGGAQDYLHEAALAHDPPSGTFYDPENDASAIPSLGVHEHWNNPDEKKYSRNLGTGDGIELISSQPPSPCEGDFDTDGDVDGSDLALFAADFGRTDCASGPPCEGDFDNDGDVDGSDLALFAADFGRTDCP